MMLGQGLTRPEKFSMYAKETFRQTHDIGIGSLPIIAIISTFIGAVTAVQFAKQFLDYDLAVAHVPYRIYCARFPNLRTCSNYWISYACWKGWV